MFYHFIFILGFLSFFLLFFFILFCQFPFYLFSVPISSGIFFLSTHQFKIWTLNIISNVLASLHSFITTSNISIRKRSLLYIATSFIRKIFSFVYLFHSKKKKSSQNSKHIQILIFYLKLNKSIFLPCFSLIFFWYLHISNYIIKFFF